MDGAGATAGGWGNRSDWNILTERHPSGKSRGKAHPASLPSLLPGTARAACADEQPIARF
jgi:hypothetical protein